MNNEIKGVSIIVPVYNMEKYLVDCLESLVNQTMNNIEIIIINDGSTDGSMGIIDTYQEKYPEKIRVYSQENSGQAVARNVGISLSKMEYIGFVDSDDIVDCEMFAAMYQMALQEDSDLVECDYMYCKEEDGKRIRMNKYAKVMRKQNNRDLFMNPLVSPWNKLFKASILKNNDIVFPEGLIYEDTAFYINCIPYINKMAYIDKEFVYHFQRQNSTQMKKDNLKVGDMLKVIKIIIQHYKDNDFWDEFHDELEYFCIRIMLCSSLGRIGLLKNKKLKKALLSELITLIQDEFPQYKKNKYLQSGKLSLYLKGFDKKTIIIYERMSAWGYKLKMKI